MIARREQLIESWAYQPVGNRGSVRLRDLMGNDFSVVEAARVSYGSGLAVHKLEREMVVPPGGTAYCHQQVCKGCGKIFPTGAVMPSEPPHEGHSTHCIPTDRQLIRYMMRHHHGTPFEMCELKLLIEVPMDTWRQVIRQRMASVNETSTRYRLLELMDDLGEITGMTQTEIDAWRLQSSSSKQGSEGFLSVEEGKALTEKELELQKLMVEVYQERIDAGVAKEQARKDLGLSTMTQAYWKIDIRNLFNFLHMRLDSHAQKEIRDLAIAISNIVKDWLPLCWEAFVDYQLEARTFSRMDMEVLKKLVAIAAATMPGPNKNRTLIKMFKPRLVELGMSARERKELWVDLELLDAA